MGEEGRQVKFDLADLHDTIELVVLALPEFVIVVTVGERVIGVPQKVANHVVGSFVK